MKRWLILWLIIVALVFSTSAALAGGGMPKWTPPETVQSQAAQGQWDLVGSGTSAGSNDGSIFQKQDDQWECADVGQYFSGSGAGFDATAIVNGSWGQDAWTNGKEVTLSEGGGIESGTSLTTTPGFCWAPGSAGCVTNNFSLKQSQSTDLASQSECIKVDTWISGANGGGGTAYNSFVTQQDAWTAAGSKGGKWGCW